MVTTAQLLMIRPHIDIEKINLYLHPINDAMRHYEIDLNMYREAAFLATILHESVGLSRMLEEATGAAYEGRLDLGNNQPGDGAKFKGRGAIQITGRNNYALCASDLSIPLLVQPELLEEPELAILSAGWFWDQRKLNALADQHLFGKICQRINGGFNGLDSRINYFVSCYGVLNAH